MKATDFESNIIIAKFLILCCFFALFHLCVSNVNDYRALPPSLHTTDGTSAQTPEGRRPRQRPNGLAMRANALQSGEILQGSEMNLRAVISDRLFFLTDRFSIPRHDR